MVNIFVSCPSQLHYLLTLTLHYFTTLSTNFLPTTPFHFFPPSVVQEKFKGSSFIAFFPLIQINKHLCQQGQTQDFSALQDLSFQVIFSKGTFCKKMFGKLKLRKVVSVDQPTK